MHPSKINDKTAEAHKLIKRSAEELAAKYNIEPPQFKRPGVVRRDKDHLDLFFIEGLADFLNRLNSLPVQATQEGVEDNEPVEQVGPVEPVGSIE